MSKLLNDATITAKATLAATDRIVNFDPATGEIFYQTRTAMNAQNRGTLLRSGAGTLTISAHGVYSFTGTTSTWTIEDSIVGPVHLFNGGSGNITLSGTLNSNILGSLSPGASITLWWDGTEYIT